MIMKKTIVAIALIFALVFAGCSVIPEDYRPPRYRKIAIIGTYIAPMDYDIDDREDLEDAVTDGILEGIADVISGNYPEWRSTSELARLCVRCGYDVYLVAPEEYFEQRKEDVDVQHQRRFEGWVDDDYWDYIGQMKGIISEAMEPTAYIICKQDDPEEEIDDFTVEMRHWDNNNRIFSMSYGYFMDNYGEFFCGADVGEDVPQPETEPKIIDGKGKKDEPEVGSDYDDTDGKGSQIQ